MVARHNAPRAAAPRGPASQRRAKADRDGDVVMGVPFKGRGAVGKNTPTPTGPRKDALPRSSRGGILSATAQREILRKAGTSDMTMKEARPSVAKRGLVELKVTGWNKSKASGDADGGLSSLIKWLEKKGSTKLGSRVRSLKIRKFRTEGSDLIIKVMHEDAGALVRMNNYGWAGISIGIELMGGPVQDSAAPSSEAEKTKAMLRSVLERRYDFETKFLNLSGLGADEELKKQHIFDSKSTAGKFFPAMMRVLELSFDKPEERDAAVTSVSLANNDLEDLAVVSTLSLTLPKLQNLDLSNNKLDKLATLDVWRKRFYHLQHLILTGNPLEQNEPTYAQEVVSWYPNLLQLNGIQMRTEEEVAKKSKGTELPFPIRSALFQDEGGIAEQFVRTFFMGFDSDRTALAAHYYDDNSDFSYAVNTQAPSDPAGAEKIERGEWEGYIKNSRNMKKITQLPARQNRLFRGAKAVGDAFASLPKTKHPDLAAEARKWMIEAKMVPGVPDATGQSASGVDGFKITISGEFEEIDHASGQAKKKRSFDRTFILGPGTGPAVVRVVNDILTVRAYGGAQALEPDNAEGWNLEAAPQQQQAAPVEAAGQLPAGISLEIAEQMVAELTKQTGMTMQYSKDCLDQVAWNFEAGLEAFARVKDSLPVSAFMQPTT
ncbi:hypothetical protein LTR36_003022 [Oleoguttula mirabilis]|uniref:mRNA export factor MEX67 n=1 Tax=Oleoguttula mirabilis TaxID=1507867 RepID=A0AAV9JWC4_9PEZI|nr:hypothetical protein LTR36_003022 [Oleoguttula mirabilis]